MFEGEEYRSYRDLCRALRLMRDFKLGDFVHYWDDEGRLADSIDVIAWDDSRDPTSATEGVFWLPRLDQWLAMLEETGSRNIGFWRGDQWDQNYIKCGVLVQVVPGELDFGDLETAPTREEACARLWLAVTGREGR